MEHARWALQVTGRGLRKKLGVRCRDAIGGHGKRSSIMCVLVVLAICRRFERSVPLDRPDGVLLKAEPSHTWHRHLAGSDARAISTQGVLIQHVSRSNAQPRGDPRGDQSCGGFAKWSFVWITPNRSPSSRVALVVSRKTRPLGLACGFRRDLGFSSEISGSLTPVSRPAPHLPRPTQVTKGEWEIDRRERTGPLPSRRRVAVVS